MNFFTHDGARVAYVDVAPTTEDIGEPILLIHGFASNHAVNWVNTLWVKTLTHAGRRVVALDNRGHGQSDKPHDPESYALPVLAEDARALLDHLDIGRCDVMGYSMGARITAFLALAHPALVRSAILGGLGQHLVSASSLPLGIADAMDAPALESLTDPTQRMFRAFADANGNDRRALAACIRGARQMMSAVDFGRIACPLLVAIGTKDAIAGDPHALAALNPRAQALDIPGRDHNLAVGDRVFKEGALDFLTARA
jgi:pimeloyl-ACP methyl ester carboxylesterase